MIASVFFSLIGFKLAKAQSYMVCQWQRTSSKGNVPRLGTYIFPLVCLQTNKYDHHEIKVQYNSLISDG